ncbi:MAG: hypothetical protein ACD_3C00086G0010 [uncultured bacterium (gcode 4)]|uniref:Uncharacterized protein n=1 Tax=uncultured bacterium (gcode 4) TaxID=1234023 RepID=K2FAP0_9BACT|nr:MAG: hypothetical protein ACD_3C00086G0010 [uncultured bacterium (gcode 4)]
MDKKVYEYISKVTWEQILEYRKCKWCNEEFAFYSLQKDIEDKLWVNHKHELCFDCTFRSIFAYRNERHLYKRRSDKTWKSMVSRYPESFEWKVFEAIKLAEEDFSIKDNVKIENLSVNEMWEEFLRLNSEIPEESLVNDGSENSEYANHVWWSKNIYLSTSVYYGSEDILYTDYAFYSKDIVDWAFNIKTTRAYQSINLNNCDNCFYCENLKDSSSCYFSYDLLNCTDCLFSFNLAGKKYHILNKEYSKADYDKKLSEIKEKMRSYSWLKEIEKEFQRIKNKTIHKNLFNPNSLNVAWDNITDSKKAIYCFEWNGIENSLVCWWDWKDCFWVVWAWMEVIYNWIRMGWSQKVLASANVLRSNNVFHSQGINNSSNIIFSKWLQNKQYHILNRELAKEDWEKQKVRIIKEMEWRWWEFFPPLLSTFPYNDAVALEWYPVNKIILLDRNKKPINEEIFDKDWEWIVYVLESDKFISEAILDLWWEEKIKIKWRTKEVEINIPDWIQIIQAIDIPDRIDDIEDDILQKALICEKSWRPFRIIKAELEFYIKYGLPIPRIHPDIRHLERLKRKTPKKLYLRKCDKCESEMLSVYDDNVEFKVYCEDCYNKEVI